MQRVVAPAVKNEVHHMSLAHFVSPFQVCSGVMWAGHIARARLTSLYTQFHPNVHAAPAEAVPDQDQPDRRCSCTQQSGGGAAHVARLRKRAGQGR